MFQVKTGLAVLAALVSGTAFASAATLRPAAHAQFPHATDSNSPGHWDGPLLYLFNSTGFPYRSYGSNVFQLGNTTAGAFYNTGNRRGLDATALLAAPGYPFR